MKNSLELLIEELEDIRERKANAFITLKLDSETVESKHHIQEIADAIYAIENAGNIEELKKVMNRTSSVLISDTIEEYLLSMEAITTC